MDGDGVTERKVLEARARRRTRRAGFVARKSRWRRGTVDNRGGFQVIEPYSNWIVAGERFDMTPEDLIAWCEERERG
jgi:hypothetical protein